jgi:hypothetical protein
MEENERFRRSNDRAQEGVPSITEYSPDLNRQIIATVDGDGNCIHYLAVRICCARKRIPFVNYACTIEENKD